MPERNHRRLRQASVPRGLWDALDIAEAMHAIALLGRGVVPVGLDEDHAPSSHAGEFGQQRHLAPAIRLQRVGGQHEVH